GLSLDDHLREWVEQGIEPLANIRERNDLLGEGKPFALVVGLTPRATGQWSAGQERACENDEGEGGRKTFVNLPGVRLHARHTRSMMVAVPIPAPMQSVTRAVCAPVRSSSSSTVPRIMAPVAPSGWPMAMAPPLTLILSRG